MTIAWCSSATWQYVDEFSTWCDSVTRRVICEGIAEEYFKLSYGDYTDGDYSHGSHSQSISSPEWEPLEQDVDEGDDLVMLMMRWSV